MSITLRGIGTEENPAVAAFLIRNKKTGALHYWGGDGITFYHPLADSVDVATGGGVTDAVDRKMKAVGSGLSSGGGRNRVWTGFSPLSSFYLLRTPGTLSIIVKTHDGESLTGVSYWRPPTQKEMTVAFDSGKLNKNLVELVSLEDETAAWDPKNKDVPMPEDDAETLLLSIEDTVERLRGLLG